MADKDGLFDWSQIDVSIVGEADTRRGIRKSREELEKLVAPYAATRPTNGTGGIIQFRGKRRYLKPFKAAVTDMEIKRIGHAVRALQCLYRVEAAWDAGDIDLAVRMSVGYAIYNVHLYAIRTFDADIVETLAGKLRYTGIQKVRGEKSAILKKDDPRKLLITAAYRSNKHRADSHKAIAQELFRQGIRGRRKTSTGLDRPVSTKTIGRWLEVLGLSDNAGVVRGHR